MKKYPVFGYRTKRLKNGTIYPEQLVVEAVQCIEAFRRAHPNDFFELVKFCRFTSHEVSAECYEKFKQADFLHRGEVKDIIRDVVVSSVVGRTFTTLEVTSPLPDEEAKLLC